MATKKQKIAAAIAGALAALGIGVGVAMAGEKNGDSPKPPNPNGTGTWNPGEDDYAGGGAGGKIGGRVVDDALRNAGHLPPGSILLSGPNLPCRVFAIGFFWANGVDYGIVADREELDKYVQEEILPGRDISTAECVIVAVSPDGQRVRAYMTPPMSAEELGEALRPIAEFSGQM